MKQTYRQYLKSRIEFQFLVGVWMEFDIDTDVKFEEDDEYTRQDFAIPCMALAPKVKKSPKIIADILKPYVEDVYGVEKVENVKGYLNIFLDRRLFLFYAIKNFGSIA